MSPAVGIGVDKPPPTQISESYYGRGVMLLRPPSEDGWLVGHTGSIRGFSSMVAWSTSQDAVIAITLSGSDRSEDALWTLHEALRTTLESP